MDTSDLWVTLPSPLGEIALAASARGLLGCWFTDQRHVYATLPPSARRLPRLPTESASAAARLVLEGAAWVEAYFAGEDPGWGPTLDLRGTEFQRRVWDELRAIPPGQVSTYGHIAQSLGQVGEPTSARAVGGAVGRNPVSLMVPCHRVIGSGGALTGYAGGIDRKRWLLRHEGVALAESGDRVMLTT